MACATWAVCWWRIPAESTPRSWRGSRTANSGTNMMAVLADSPSLARSQMRDAVAFAEEQQIPLAIINTEELDRAGLSPQ